MPKRPRSCSRLNNWAALGRYRVNAKAATKNINLDSSDLLTIKQMIQQYQSGQSTSVQPENLELIELKHALKFFGIDFKMILEHYRKNV